MNNSTKTILITLMVMSLGFGVLEWFNGSMIYATLWLFAAAIISLFYGWRQSAQKKKPETSLESLLEPETQKKIKEQGIVLNYPIKNRKNQEVCLWYDAAGQDYYNGKTGVMILTNKRLMFEGKDFSFEHPTAFVSIKPTQTGIRVSVNGRSMGFVSPSSEALLAAWQRLEEKSNEK